MLFSDEWGGGGAPKCRATDKKEWGCRRDLHDRESEAQVPELLQAPLGPDRQGELRRAQRLADPDSRARRDGAGVVPGRHLGLRLDRRRRIRRRSRSSTAVPWIRLRQAGGGSWSAYWYNGTIVSSEIARGLDVAELVPSQYVSQNEIDAAKTVQWSTSTRRASRRSCGRRASRWPRRTSISSSGTSVFPLARIAAVRQEISSAERATGPARHDALTQARVAARGRCAQLVRRTEGAEVGAGGDEPFEHSGTVVVEAGAEFPPRGCNSERSACPEHSRRGNPCCPYRDAGIPRFARNDIVARATPRVEGICVLRPSIASWQQARRDR